MFESGDKVVCVNCLKPLCIVGRDNKLYLKENKTYIVKNYIMSTITNYIVLDLNGQELYLNADRFMLLSNHRRNKILKLKQNIKNYESITSVI